MSTQKKILLGLASVFGLLIFVSAYLYSKPQYKYLAVSALKTYRVAALARKSTASAPCAESENKANCLNTLILSKGGIEFSSDVQTYLNAATIVCDGKSNEYCVYESTDYILNQLNIDHLWVANNIRKSDPMYNILLNFDLSEIESILRNYRKKVAEYYESEVDPAKKLNALNFLKLVDGKIQLMQRSRIKSL